MYFWDSLVNFYPPCKPHEEKNLCWLITLRSLEVSTVLETQWMLNKYFMNE